jgi:hypothetical protein
VLSICERHGWTYAQFNALPEEEQADWLAFDARRKAVLRSLIDVLDKKIEEGKPVEMASYLMLQLALVQ